MALVSFVDTVSIDILFINPTSHGISDSVAPMREGEGDSEAP